jgi:glycopeptide antibiotics resistance protein
MEHEIKNVLNLTWPTLVIVLSIIAILGVTFILKSERKSTVLHEEIFNLLFLAYLIVLFELVTSQDLPGGGTNLMPFREILRYDYGTRSFYKQVFGNILMFVPLGYYATSYCMIKNLGAITVISLLSSSIIETVQHFIGRTFDIDDIILNVVGGIIGFLLYRGLNSIKKHLPDFLQRDWIYNILSVLLVGLIVFYLIKII